jgi:hypothetical protein
MSNMAIEWSFPRVCTVQGVAESKGLSHESGWIKSAENLGAPTLRETYRLIPLSAESTLLHTPFKGLYNENFRGIFVKDR